MSKPKLKVSQGVAVLPKGTDAFLFFGNTDNQTIASFMVQLGYDPHSYKAVLAVCVYDESEVKPDEPAE